MSELSQNPNHKQFDKVEDITKLYLKSPDSQYAIYPAMLANPWTYAQHYRYVKLKDGRIFGSLADMVKGADNVLMAHETDKVIAINDYLHWLRCNYKIDLEYKPKKSDKDKSVEVPKSNLSNQQLCSGTPLQTYLKKQ